MIAACFSYIATAKFAELFSLYLLNSPVLTQGEKEFLEKSKKELNQILNNLQNK
jgi:hypothetical protein